MKTKTYNQRLLTNARRDSDIPVQPAYSENPAHKGLAEQLANQRASEAMARASKLEADKVKDKPQTVEVVTDSVPTASPWDQWIDEYLTFKGAARTTRKGYIGVLGRFANHLLGCIGPLTKENIQGMEPGHLAGYIHHMERAVANEEMSVKTLNFNLIIIRQFLIYLNKMKLLDRNMADLITLRKEPDKLLPKDTEGGNLNAKEVQRIMDAAGKMRSDCRLRTQAIIALMVHSGLRTNESCMMKIEQYKEAKANNGIVICMRKGGHKKPVLIGNGAYPWIDAYLATRPNARDDDYLFITRGGRQLSTDRVYKTICTAQENSGVPIVKKGGHTFRRFFSTSCARIPGMDPGTLASLVGHDSIDTTFKHYVSPDLEAGLKAVRHLAGVSAPIPAATQEGNNPNRIRSPISQTENSHRESFSAKRAKKEKPYVWKSLF